MDDYNAEMYAASVKHPQWTKEEIETHVAAVFTGRKDPLDRSRR
jgi:hypothetical protein